MMGVFEVPVDSTPGAELGHVPGHDRDNLLAMTRAEHAASLGLPRRRVPPLSFAEAEAVGVACFDRWAKMTGGEPPLGRDDLGWADLVQFVWRSGTAAIADREGGA